MRRRSPALNKFEGTLQRFVEIEETKRPPDVLWCGLDARDEPLQPVKNDGECEGTGDWMGEAGSIKIHGVGRAAAANGVRHDFFLCRGASCDREKGENLSAVCHGRQV